MSTLNVSTIIPDEGTNTDLSLDGKGTGKVAVVDDATVGGAIAVTGATTLSSTLATAGHACVGAAGVTDATRALTVVGASDGSGSSIIVGYNSSLASKFSVRDDGLTTIGDSLVFSTAAKVVYLGATSATAANLLDDYEEGTWTPAQNGVTAAAQSGAYTKIGRLVIANFTMTTATTSDTSSMQISGLPFACATIDGSVALGYDNYAVSNTSHAYVANGTSYIQMIQNSSGASTNAVHTGKILKGSAIYYSAT